MSSIYNDCVSLINNNLDFFSSSRVLSLASGTCWLEASLCDLYKPSHITAVDYSANRIHTIAPSIFKAIAPSYDDVDLVNGDILQLQSPNMSFDLVLLSQAFHHTNQPITLLKEISRVLKPKGSVLIVGEHHYNSVHTFRQLLSHFYKYTSRSSYRHQHSLFPSYSTLFPPCFEKGDIHYSKSDYHYMFSAMGFSYIRVLSSYANLQSYLLTKIS